MAGNLTEARRWLERAVESLEATEALIKQELYHDAISRAYYSMFYAANALLILDGLNVSEKHSAVMAAFGREYIKTGKIDPKYHQMLIQDFEWRQKADYDVFWIADEEQAKKRAEDAHNFVDLITGLLA